MINHIPHTYNGLLRDVLPEPDNDQSLHYTVGNCGSADTMHIHKPRVPIQLALEHLYFVTTKLASRPSWRISPISTSIISVTKPAKTFDSWAETTPSMSAHAHASSQFEIHLVDVIVSILKKITNAIKILFISIWSYDVGWFAYSWWLRRS